MGTLAVWLGTSVGAALAFLLGRYVFKQCARDLAERYATFKALSKAIETEGMKLTFLLRLCPLVPFVVLNYLMGVTGLRLTHFMLGSLGMLPGTVVYVLLGTTISDLADAASGDEHVGKISLVLAIVGSIMALGGIIWVSVVARRKLLQEMIVESDEEI